MPPRQSAAFGQLALRGAVTRVAGDDGDPRQRAEQREHHPRPQRGLPRPEPALQRHGQRRRGAGTAHHRQHVEAGDQAGPLRREQLLDQARQQRATQGDAHPGNERPGIQGPRLAAGEPARGPPRRRRWRSRPPARPPAGPPPAGRWARRRPCTAPAAWSARPSRRWTGRGRRRSSRSAAARSPSPCAGSPPPPRGPAPSPRSGAGAGRGGGGRTSPPVCQPSEAPMDSGTLSRASA